MVQLGTQFDSSVHDDMNTFDPIPKGDYIAQIVESDLLDTSKGNGKYIKLKFEIIEGEYKGRFIWTNINIINPNPVAVEFAQKELATICRACNKVVIADTQEIHGIPMKIKVKVVPAKGDYPPGNAIVTYQTLESELNDAFSDIGNEPKNESQKEVKTEESDFNSEEVPW